MLHGFGICLNMIVKDEAHVIERCLVSVFPFIDTWVIVDTGSTDGTQQRIRELLHTVPGSLCERPWRGFAENRNEAMELARDVAEYSMVMDADEELIAEPDFCMPRLTADAYLVANQAVPRESACSGEIFYKVQLYRNSLPWRYRYGHHAVIGTAVPYTAQKLNGWLVKGYFDSARNAHPREKYLADAATVERDMASDPDDPHYTFMLAITYRGAGEYEKAKELFARRAEMGGWPEEVWYSLYQIGILQARLGREFTEVEACMRRAYEYRPTRVEPLWAMAFYSRQAGEHAKAYLCARQAAMLREPDDMLFIRRDIYRWRALDEWAVAAHHLGKFKEALDLYRRLLENAQIPAEDRGRISRNEALCAAKLT